MSFVKSCLIGLLCLSVSAVRSSNSRPELRIEPLAETLPANFLKFYLHFSEPMERGDVFRYLRLVKVKADGSEEEVVEPFREVELWGADFKTLTLWLHPGRQKPGVNLNVDLGPVLEEGESYRLIVSAEWKTELGWPVTGSRSKKFSVGPVDTQQPNPGKWGIERLSAVELVLMTGDFLDPASVRKRIEVRRELREDPLPTVVTVSEDRVFLKFMTMVPSGTVLERWYPGAYRISIYPELEDLAGNSLSRPFNLNLEENPNFVEKTDPVVVSFTINEDLDAILTTP
ncbi:hypothetical protein N9Z18_00010 [Verrucomicrobiales bacterium]|jgi:hypothetical protein|nr:hypothetical protein [Verrucomicrobiales bacterium]MDB4358602.1 hypothetical protein [Verrucomicrobiales bacterium]